MVSKTAPAAWEALQTYEYDLVITDNQMPRMTGLEMIGKLRSSTMTVPVIMALQDICPCMNLPASHG